MNEPEPESRSATALQTAIAHQMAAETVRRLKAGELEHEGFAALLIAMVAAPLYSGDLLALARAITKELRQTA